MTQYGEFLAMVTMETDECIVWPHMVNHKGYGRVHLPGGRYASVHVLACTMVHGDRPLKHQAAHRCGHSACLNPRHLRWATQVENEADKRLHGTQARGSRVGTSKLTESDVVAIRQAAETESSRSIAQRYSISDSHVRHIVLGDYWKQIA